MIGVFAISAVRMKPTVMGIYNSFVSLQSNLTYFHDIHQDLKEAFGTKYKNTSTIENSATLYHVKCRDEKGIVKTDKMETLFGKMLHLISKIKRIIICQMN